MEQKNDFSKGAVSKNILKLAAPMTLAQLINILYSVVDRMYLGHIPGIGALALTGLGLTLPLISLLMGVANLCGIGGSPLCSIYRGKGKNDEAERIMGNSFTLLLILGSISSVLLLFFKKPILYLFGASDATFPYANDYLSIYLYGTLFVMIGLGMNPFINSQGFGKIGMMTVVLGAVVNIVLDPLFIFVFGMGVKGAACATVIAQGCSAVWVLKFLTGKKTILRLRLSNLRLSTSRALRIISLGLSGFFVNCTNSLVQVVCNFTLSSYGGDLYVGIMTVINSVREVLHMPLQGLINGSQPVLGYNYGAKKYERVLQCIRFTAVITVSYSLLVWTSCMLLPRFFFRIFSSEITLIEAGVPSMRMYFSLYMFMSLQLVGQSVFTGLGKAGRAIFFSLLRKAVINAPLTVLLPFLGMGTAGVFVAEAVSQFAGGLACFVTMLFTVYRPLIKHVKNGNMCERMHEQNNPYKNG